ncbi:MAG: winged helix DNA-binding protein [Microbacteriaceae bacterium]|nr:winged helix DNA-binding protein [Microbacteriaceae bacterium]
MPSEPRFDEAIHAPTRLRLCAMLRPIDFAEFPGLMEMLGISEANLSKTVRRLVELGYATTSKHASPEHDDRRRRTRVALTDAGRRAFDGHLAALQQLALEAGAEQ